MTLTKMNTDRAARAGRPEVPLVLQIGDTSRATAMSMASTRPTAAMTSNGPTGNRRPGAG